MSEDKKITNRTDKTKDIKSSSAEAVGNVVVDTAPNAVPVIPADWAALGATFGYAPRLAEDLKLWITGPSGEGKSTFVSSIPDNVILDFDDGANGIPGAKALRIQIKDYEHYMAVTGKMIEEGRSKKKLGKRITIDTVDEWVGMIINQLQIEKNVEDITEFGRSGHGYALIRARCWSRLRALEQAGYVWACVGHISPKTEINPVDMKERTVLRETVFPSFAKKITTKCDFKLTVYNIPTIVEKTKRKRLEDGRIIPVPDGTITTLKYYIDSQTTSAKEGKSRAVPTMDRKFEIPLIDGWKEFERRYNDAVAETKKKYSS